MLATKRCALRRFAASDAAALHAVLSDKEVMRYIEPPFDMERTEEFIREAGLSDPPLVYALIWRETGELIGHVIFHPWEGDVWEIGWVIARQFWGKGAASEVTAALIEKAREMKIPELIMECAPEQAATVRIAEKLGFERAKSGGNLLVFRKKL